MKHNLNVSEEVLLDNLSFTLPASGEYVLDRRSVAYRQEGSMPIRRKQELNYLDLNWPENIGMIRARLE